MNIHEYQGKDLLRRFGVPAARGYPCFSAEAAVRAAENLGGRAWVVKAQVHAGGRGKGGGVKLATSIPVVREYAAGMLGRKLVTHQTGPEGRLVRRLLVEEGADIASEFYVGMVVDRATQCVALVASGEGGVEIEQVAASAPERIHRLFIDPLAGLADAEADDIAARIGIPPRALPQARAVMQGLYRAFDECDATLVEINPLVLTRAGRLLALDAKFNFDPNALFRHPEIVALRDPDEEDQAELEAARFDLSYLSLDGNVGCLVNGAGLAMATMDAIGLHGGAPANFLDVGGGATTERVTEAFKLMLKNPGLRAVLVNIFGGIMKCDVIAAGIVAAVRQVDLKVPLVVRMKGTNEDIGKTILAESGLPVIAANNMSEAAQLAVAAAREE
jgi:succinyl-CoA synthetase beta subunit